MSRKDIDTALAMFGVLLGLVSIYQADNSHASTEIIRSMLETLLSR